VDRATFLLLGGHLGGVKEKYWEFFVVAKEGGYAFCKPRKRKGEIISWGVERKRNGGPCMLQRQLFLACVSG
jgi:hypothetical protein